MKNSTAAKKESTPKPTTEVPAVTLCAAEPAAASRDIVEGVKRGLSRPVERMLSHAMAGAAGTYDDGTTDRLDTYMSAALEDLWFSMSEALKLAEYMGGEEDLLRPFYRVERRLASLGEIYAGAVEALQGAKAVQP